jgi:hypothetical protein
VSQSPVTHDQHFQVNCRTSNCSPNNTTLAKLLAVGANGEAGLMTGRASLKCIGYGILPHSIQLFDCGTVNATVQCGSQIAQRTGMFSVPREE